MNVLSFFTSRKPQPKEYYAAVSLREKDGELRILEIDQGRRSVRALVRKSFAYTNGWINIVEDIDEVLYLCERETGFEARSILFILYSHLVDQQGKTIKKEYYDAIKETVKQLDLTTVGYMEYHEAVSRHYADQEQFPLHSLIVEVDHPSLMTFLYQDGQLLRSEIVQKTNQCAADLEVALQKLSLEAILPTRIILYEAPSLVSDSTAIVAHAWPEELFPQQPRIDVLKPSELENALLHGISWQLFAGDTSTNPAVGVVVAAPVAQAVSEESIYEEEVVSPIAAPVVEEVVESEQELGDIESLGFTSGGQSFEDLGNSPASTRGEPIIGGAAGIFGSILSRIPKFSFPKFQIPMNANKKVIIIGVSLLVFLAAGAGGILFLLHKTTLTLTYALSPLKETISLGQPIPVEKSEKEVSTKVSIVTTGSKEVGDAAKGSVTVYNAESKVQALPKGTIIKTSAQEFLLDKDIKIASASEQLTPGGDVLTVTGKETATVTAEAIGEEYNLKKDTKFTVGSFSQSTVFAVAANAFSGGSKKKVQAASKEDVAKLRKEADTRLKEELGEVVKTDESKGVVDSLTELSAGVEKFSTDLDKEAKSIELTKTATATYYIYDTASTKQAALESLRKALGSKYDFEKSKLTFKIVSAELDEDTITADLETVLSPVPLLDSEKIRNDVKGKSLEALDSYFRNDLKASEVTLRPKHSIFFLNDRLPFFTKNIEVVVEVK